MYGTPVHFKIVLGVYVKSDTLPRYTTCGNIIIRNYKYNTRAAVFSEKDEKNVVTFNTLINTCLDVFFSHVF